MKFRGTVLSWGMALGVALGALRAPEASAQQQRDAGVRIRSVNASPVRTPEYTIRGSQPQTRTRDWLRIVVDYEVQAEWTDELVFEYHVLLKGRDPQADPFSLLTGNVTYVHVPRDRRLRSVMYVHPSIMARYGALEGVAVEIKLAGQSVAVDGQGDWRRWPLWVQQLTAKRGLVMRPDQTPFAVLAGDEYEMVKPE